MRIVLNLEVNLGRTDIFIMLSHPDQKRKMSFHLIELTFMSSRNV